MRLLINHQRRRHHEKFARDVQVQPLLQLEVLDVLRGDLLHRDVVDVQLVLLIR
jgi:hypothetical protein